MDFGVLFMAMRGSVSAQCWLRKENDEDNYDSRLNLLSNICIPNSSFSFRLILYGVCKKM